ncbi:tetratricopeptide repeat protein [Acrocarpospora sp. B8E8]|uniref:nSTAND1 domain-containing NTPase n=1 Tax=Acrocarpospora sp. B8E8 TaxID=3153572 RepID=UPI00325DFDD2
MNGSPYVGPRPFLRSEARLFFGREAEARSVQSDWLADRVTVLHGSAAVGKTSLLNAGVLPPMEQELQVVTLPPSRISLPARPLAAPPHNAYVYTVLSDWAGGVLPRSGSTVSEFLADRASGLGPAGRLLGAIDQFEEVFAAFPTRLAERTGLLSQLADALRAIPALNLLLLVRDEHLASVTACESLFRMPFTYRRLDALDEPAATEAIQGPTRGTSHEWAPDTVREIIDRLRASTYTDPLGNTATITTPLVEPLHLQIVCSELWEDPDQATTLDVRPAIARFYERAVRAAALETGISEDSVRRWIESAFIIEHGTRGTRLRGLASTADMPNALADALADALAERHVLTARTRLRSTWYQLSQDLMIDAVRRSNAAWFAVPRPGEPDEIRPTDFAVAAESAFGAGDFPGARRLASVAASRFAADGDTRRQAQAMALHGEIALIEGDLRTAGESFREALNGFESLADQVSTAKSMSALASVLASSGDHQAAADLYRQAVERHRADAEALIGYAQALWNLGSPADAEAFFTQALATGRSTGRALAGRGQVRVDLRLYDRALLDLDQALGHTFESEDEADVHSARAIALMELDRADEARTAIELAQRLAPDSSRVRERAARIR